MDLLFLSSNISLFRITCCEHVLVKIHRLQNQGRRYAWCRWTKQTPWLPPPRSPSSLIPRCDHMRHVIIYDWWVLTTVDTASSVRKFGRVTIPSLWKFFSKYQFNIFNTFLRKVSLHWLTRSEKVLELGSSTWCWAMISNLDTLRSIIQLIGQ